MGPDMLNKVIWLDWLDLLRKICSRLLTRAWQWISTVKLFSWGEDHCWRIRQTNCPLKGIKVYLQGRNYSQANISCRYLPRRSGPIEQTSRPYQPSQVRRILIQRDNDRFASFGGRNCDVRCWFSCLVYKTWISHALSANSFHKVESFRQQRDV